VSKLTDLLPLRGLKLKTLSLRDTRVADLTPLQGMPLTRLALSGTRVADISPLKGMPLESLDLWRTPVADVSPLKGAPLTHLNVGVTKVRDLTPLRGMKLVSLSLQKTTVTDLSPLKGMPLKVIQGEFQPERDIAILREITTLETINLKPAAEFFKGGNAGATTTPVEEAWIKEVAKLAPDKQVEAVAAKLKERNPGFDGKVGHDIRGGAVFSISFSADQITDISPVRALTGLKHFSCFGSRLVSGRLADLSPLAGLPLTHVGVAATRVSDLTPLKGMPLVVLNVEHTQVTDLSPVKDMPLKVLVCPFKPERDAALLRSIKTLEKINTKPAAEFWKNVDAKGPDK
jgi:Leucine-rich repeat (LRR) protein